jgi:hypothetical protein
VARYRLSTWFPDRPDMIYSRAYKSACRLCAIGAVLAQAQDMERAHGRPQASADWRVEMLRDAMDRYEIMWHSRMPRTSYVVRHAH